MPTPDECRRALAEGRTSRPGARNPYAGRRVLASAWAAGNRDACRREYAAFRHREAERRRRARADVDDAQ